MTPFGAQIALSAHGQEETRAAATALRRSLVLIQIQLPNSGGRFGSGMVIDATGGIMTAAHVVAGVGSADVLLPDGRRLTGQVVGHDTLTDVAVLRVAATGLTPIVPAPSAGERPLDPLVLVGYTDVFPAAPAVRIGQVIDVVGNNYYGNAEVNVLEDALASEPGDSGAPVANLQG